jgi:hypothetical protein
MEAVGKLPTVTGTLPIIAGIDISRSVRGMLPMVVATLPIEVSTLPVDDDMDMDTQSSWRLLCARSSGNER